MKILLYNLFIYLYWYDRMEVAMIKEILFGMICTAMLFLAGCGILNKTDTERFAGNDEIITDEDMSKYALSFERGFELGIKIKEILDNPEFDKPAIRINEEYISQYAIETAKVFVEGTPAKDLKHEIISKIKANVLRREANRLNIKPADEEVEEYFNFSIRALEENGNNFLDGYLKGRDMTIEEYTAEIKDDIYYMKQGEALQAYILKDMEQELIKEADKRKTSVWEVEKEYYDEYVDELIKKADIEYLDPEIKQIIS